MVNHDSIPVNPPSELFDDAQEREMDRLMDTAGHNAISAREHVLGAKSTESHIAIDPGTSPAQLRPPRKPQTARDKAAADARPDLQPFPYGHKDSF